MQKYSFFIGVDVSKDWIDVAVTTGPQPKYQGQFLNNEEGFVNLINSISQTTDIARRGWFICFENTGVYSKALLAFLCENEIATFEADPRTLSQYLRMIRGKDDRGDAIEICRFIYRYHDELTPTKPEHKRITRLKTLLSRRALLVNQRKSLKNAEKVVYSGLSDAESERVKEANAELIKHLNVQIREMEKMIKKVMAEDECMKKNNQLIQSVKGIGFVISAHIIAITHNFSLFDYNARKFACYSGIAPFPNQSGKFKGRDRVSHIGNKKLKALLSNAAVSACVFDPQIKAYSEKKKAEGKHYASVLNAVKNKLIARVFAVVKRQTPYVDTMAYKS